MTTRITTDNITDGTITAADLSNLPNLIDWQAVVTADGSTTTFTLNEIIHEEDILLKEGANIVSVGKGVTADNNIIPSYLTVDGTLRSADHELGATLSHDTANKKTTITFTKEVPAEGTIIKVERSNDKYLAFRNKGI